MTTPISFYPPPENGIHSWLFGRAKYLRGIGATRESSELALRAFLDRTPMRRKPTEREIISAFNDAWSQSLTARPMPCPVSWSPSTGWPAHIALPRKAPVPGYVEQCLSASGDLPASPCSAVNLFAPDEKVIVGTADNASAMLRPWSACLDNAERLTFVCPNPVADRIDRSVFLKSRVNVGPRRYIVFEDDEDSRTKEEKLRVILGFARLTGADLRLVVDSGGKSIHGWFSTQSMNDAELFDWFSLAVMAGADPRLFLPEQYVRMPGGTRADGARQKILFSK